MWPFHQNSDEETLQKFLKNLSGALGTDLISVVVFGSKASGETRSGDSSINTLIILRDVCWDSLQKMSPACQSWMKAGHPLPVLSQQDELSRFAQSRPIEFLDIKDHYRVVYGADLIPSLTVDRLHLKSQCLQELSVKEVLLRQGILLAGKDSKKIRDLLVRSSSSILTLFRAVLRLSDNGVGNKVEAAKTLAARIGFDAAPLVSISQLHMRREDDDLQDLAKQYLDVVERVLAYVSGS